MLLAKLMSISFVFWTLAKTQTGFHKLQQTFITKNITKLVKKPNYSTNLTLFLGNFCNKLTTFFWKFGVEFILTTGEKLQKTITFF